MFKNKIKILIIIFILIFVSFILINFTIGNNKFSNFKLLLDYEQRQIVKKYIFLTS